MTEYEKILSKMQKAREMALATGDENLRVFYTNAYYGFKIKLEKLTLERAERWVE